MPEIPTQQIEMSMAQNVSLNKPFELKLRMRFTPAMLRHLPELPAQNVNHAGEHPRKQLFAKQTTTPTKTFTNQIPT